MKLTKRWQSLIVVLSFLAGVSCGYFEKNHGEIARVSYDLQLPERTSGSVFSEREIECLADVVYNEARGETRIGQIAVAAVVINRSLSARFPQTDLCGITKAKNQFVSTARPATPVRCREHTQLSKSLPKATLSCQSESARQVALWASQYYGTLPEDMRSWMFFHSHSKGPRGSVTIQRHHFYV